MHRPLVVFHDRIQVLAAAAAVVAVGMAYSLWWAPVVHHTSSWIVPGDIWGTFRDAHIIGWGGAGNLYTSNTQALTGFISLPAMPALLSPIAILSGALGLTESLPFTLVHPTAWLLLGPIELMLGVSVLLPLNALARRLDVPRPRRIALIWLESAVIWPVVAMWGHPEDLVALGLAIYSLMSVRDEHWRRSALLLGAAVAFQPLVVLLAPLTLAAVSWRRWASFSGIALTVPLGLLLAPLLHSPRTTAHVLIDQPTYPGVDHPTPWLALSTVLDRAKVIYGTALTGSSHGLTLHSVASRATAVVAGGPVRLLPLALAVLAAIAVFRWKPTEPNVWLIASLCLASRCAFEAVMTPYYAAPALLLALVVAADAGVLRLVIGAACAGLCTYAGYRHVGTWNYYLPVTAALLLAVCSAIKPGGPRPRVLDFQVSRVPQLGESPAALGGYGSAPSVSS